MWLLFTVTILLTREVVGNFSADKHDEEKKVENENYIHTFPQLQATNLKHSTEKLHDNKTSEKHDAGERRKRSIDEIGADQEPFTEDFEKRKRPLSSWFYWANKDMSIPIKERSKESSQEKKTPRFSPWGGKRGGSYLSDPELRQNTHVFNSWGGKRGNEISKLVPPEKNAKLYAWNRVDSDDNVELKRVSKSNPERQAPFNSWGGKRALNNIDFTSPILQDLHQLEGKIAYGKRKGEYEKSQDKLLRKLEERRMPLVQKFGSWGGKRFASQEERENVNLSGDDFFESLKSKMPKKRTNRALKKREFQPWGGKRSPETIPETPNDNERRPASFFVRKVFFPWGG